ncbi:MAG: LysM peptidoglycan-binding domain-containing protein [Oligoflexia bacterium]|nr:LysM peptidoglycan-binding domain-containing protein [Oligoflexia bacterium]
MNRNDRARRPRRKAAIPLPLVALLPLFAASAAHAALTPEHELARLSKFLRPVPDEQWEEIAGERISERYEIVKGDTLYDISKRLFGDPRYWPKIWALNNRSITNPHWIRPGRKIAFMPGTGTSLPAVALQDGETLSDAGSSPPEYFESGEPRPSSEWKKLPPQRWDLFNASIGKRVEEIGFGFDTKDRIKKLQSLNFRLKVFVRTEPEEILGTLHGFLTESASPGLTHEVFLLSPQERLEVGTTYAIVQEPQQFGDEESPRRGYGYLILGTVKVTGRKNDGLYLGKVNGLYHWMERGSFLVRMPARIPVLTPVPGAQPLDAALLVDQDNSTSTIAQHKQVYLDRGSEDGVARGMVFRVYRTEDPNTGARIQGNDLVREAELMVIQTSARYSTAIVTYSARTIEEGTIATLVTDAAELGVSPGVRQIVPEEDELDKLDTDEELRQNEAKELKQLERWKENPPSAPEPVPSPTASPAPTEAAEPAFPALEPAPSPEPLPQPTPEPTAEIPSPTPQPTAELAPADELPPPQQPDVSAAEILPQAPAESTTEEPPPPIMPEDLPPTP